VFNCSNTPNYPRFDTTANISSASKVPWASDPNNPSVTGPATSDYAPTVGISQAVAALTGSLPLGNPSTAGVLTMNVNLRGTKLAEVKDGTSSTILLAETGGRPSLYAKGDIDITPQSNPSYLAIGGWADPNLVIYVRGSQENGSVTPPTQAAPYPCAVNCSSGDAQMQWPSPYKYAGEVYGFHPGGANVLFADGSGHFLAYNLSVAVLGKLVTRNGHEIVSGDF
jgi:prepilin-type processing-associated H-X9-DG protein